MEEEIPKPAATIPEPSPTILGAQFITQETATTYFKYSNIFIINLKYLQQFLGLNQTSNHK